jgi:hypothetical protein
MISEEGSMKYDTNTFIEKWMLCDSFSTQHSWLEGL